MFATNSSARKIKAPCVETGDEQRGKPTAAVNRASMGPLAQAQETMEDPVDVKTIGTGLLDKKKKATYELLINAMQKGHCFL